MSEIFDNAVVVIENSPNGSRILSQEETKKLFEETAKREETIRTLITDTERFCCCANCTDALEAGVLPSQSSSHKLNNWPACITLSRYIAYAYKRLDLEASLTS